MPLIIKNIFAKSKLWGLHILTVVIILSSCGGGSPEVASIDELQEQIAQLENTLEEVRSKLNEAESETSTLTSAVNDLYITSQVIAHNWRNA